MWKFGLSGSEVASVHRGGWVDVILAMVMLGLFLVVSVGAYFGPKRWLYVATASAFLLGLSMAMLQGYALNNLITGICLGAFLVPFTYISGLATRRAHKHGMQVLRKYKLGPKTDPGENDSSTKP